MSYFNARIIYHHHCKKTAWDVGFFTRNYIQNRKAIQQLAIHTTHYNKVTRNPQFLIDHLFMMKAMHYYVFCNLWTLQVGQPVKDADTQKILDFQSLLKDNGVFNQKSIIP